MRFLTNSCTTFLRATNSDYMSLEILKSLPKKKLSWMKPFTLALLIGTTTTIKLTLNSVSPSFPQS